MIRQAVDILPRKKWANWIRSKADERAVADGCWFDLNAADRVRQFFRKFVRHSIGEWAGQPFELLDWQWNDFIAPLYGWRRSDGTRRYRRGYVQIAKKNGKSALCSGLSLYHLKADGEPSAEVLNAACDRLQAGIVYDEAAKMVESSPMLARHLMVVRSSKRIVDYRTNSVLRAISADAHRNEGLRPSCVIVDELHAQPNRKLWDALRWGGAARRQPLMLAITTAGWDKTSICYEEYQYAKGILEGRVEDLAYFAYIAEAEESDDWTEEAVWHKANPSLGHTITLESFRDDFRQASQSTASQNAFRRYRLNQWTEQDVRWLSMEKWAACAEDYDEAAIGGDTCYAGLDMATTQDICSFVMVFPGLDGKYRRICRFWAPAEANKLRERHNRTRIEPWVKAGLITVHAGDEIDFGRVRADIAELGKRFHIAKIAKDRWNSAQIGQELMMDGFEVVDFGQGIASMSAPCKEYERRITAGDMRHNDNPVLNWMAANVAVDVDAAGNIKPSKKKSSDKIDGIVCDIMATGLTMSANAGTGEIVWL
jgi:phage terminase large subunit-like protein